MLHSITVSNVNDGLSEALHWLRQDGIVATSRNGVVLKSDGPFITTYKNPCHRVMFSALRDANPFFHHMEAIWMLAGANDVQFPSRYVKQIAQYSDDGETLHGAYGYRWRTLFGYDQLEYVIKMLRSDLTTRRAVLAMWNAYDGNPPTPDLMYAASGGKDAPCNTHVYFSMRCDALDMSVLCRSNDAVWGCYGANAVHFSMLLQFIAEAVGVPVGHYTQFSNDLHVYLDRPDVDRLIATVPSGMARHRFEVRYQSDDRYRAWYMQSVTPLIAEGETYEAFLKDAELFVSDPDGDATYSTGYFEKVVAPMQVAHTAYKKKEYTDALYAAEAIAAYDWKTACIDWLERRINNATQA